MEYLIMAVNGLNLIVTLHRNIVHLLQLVACTIKIQGASPHNPWMAQHMR